jgi:hypothetical protein
MVSQPAPPPVSVAEGELFRCAPTPLLGPSDDAYEDVLAEALRLREVLDDCRDMNNRLIDLATKPAGAKP